MKLLSRGYWRSLLPAQLLLIMRITTALLLIGALHVSATGLSQTVSYSGKNVRLEQVFAAIEQQTGYGFFYKLPDLQAAKPVTIELKNIPLPDALEKILENQSLDFSIQGNTIVISPKAPAAALRPADISTSSPGEIHGRITDSTGQPLEGATIQIKGTRRIATADENGEFTLKDVGPDDVLAISFVGYGTRLVPVKGQKSISILLHVTSADLANVEVAYSNGYQQIPKERATGSYDFIDNKLIDREVTTNILDRLDGIANSVLFDHGSGVPSNTQGTTNITIRGFSTLNSNEFGPLLVLDGAPFYGDPALINPNDVENITVLKDAAAASIWGVKAGNGVIVITTKKGHLNQPLKIGFVSNISITGKPLIKDDPNFMNSNDFIDLEEYLFGQGFYNANLSSKKYPVISPVVNLLNEANQGIISNQQASDSIDALRNVDVRNDMLKYFLQNQVSQQYALNLSGGSQNVKYYLSGGYDRILSNAVGNNNDRITFNSSTTFYPIRNLEFSAGLTYSQTGSKTNNSNIEGSTPFPYTQLADSKGNPLPIAYGYSNAFIQQAQQEGYLNWQFNPLQELRENANVTTGKGTDIKINPSLKYTFIPGLSAVFNYQYETGQVSTVEDATEQSYFTRNVINEYTNLTASNKYPVPQGDILINGTTGLVSQAGRGQINFSHNWRKQSLNVIAGGEITDFATNSNTGNWLFGYNSSVGISLPVDHVDQFAFTPVGGKNVLPGGVPTLSGTDSRTVSTFSNGSYTYDNRYTVSASARRDASNLFGVSTNNKWKPLWSGGFKWQLSNEQFYKSKILPVLGLRATYGYSGNVDNSVPAVTTIGYSKYPSYITNYPYATLKNAPNPNLSWENVGQLNLAIDFQSQKNRIGGSIEYYKKYCTNLIANVAVDPTYGLGYNSYISKNSADLNTKGIDVAIISKNIVGEFRWESTVNFNYVTDKLTKYFGQEEAPTEDVYVGMHNSPTPIIGRTLESVYAYKWGGLDSAGNPQGYQNGKLSENYQGIQNDSVNNLVFKGSAVPLFFGNILNTFYWRRFSLSANIVFRLDYWIQKPTISYSGLLENIVSGDNAGNIDYDRRWQNPGDEKHTTVPSFDYPANTYRDAFYAGAEPNFLRGDNIRLQDIRLAYDLPNYRHNAAFKSLTIFAYSSNSLIIWRANRADIDPVYLTIPPSKTIAFGVNATF